MKIPPLEILRADRCVAVVRASVIGDPVGLADALASGGIRSVELTFTTPGVEDLIARVVASDTTAIVGAGTVTSASQARDAIAAGAHFLVTPGISESVAEIAANASMPIIMGAYTASEVMRALALGVSAVKIFPADAGGPGYFKSLLGPFPDLVLMASGGISAANAKDYLRAGVMCVAAGSSVVPGESVEAGDWAEITRRAAAFTSSLG
jgi:2-dehydro-3-deoxyphosphogluconate aldolase/(4S)-4-hydroxy-2-oxoglutarate aldolase